MFFGTPIEDWVKAVMATQLGNQVRELAVELEGKVGPFLRAWDVQAVARIVSEDYWRGQVPPDSQLGFAPWLIDAAIAWWQGDQDRQAREAEAARQAEAERAAREAERAAKAAGRARAIADAEQKRQARLRDTIARIETIALARARLASGDIRKALFERFGPSAEREADNSLARLEERARKEAAARGQELRAAEADRIRNQGSIDDDPELAQFAGLPAAAVVGPIVTVLAPFVFKLLTERKKRRRKR